MDFLNLNRRHKVGLLIVLVGAGLCLILDASAKQATGFVLLGLAGTWILGSLRPRTLWLLASLSLFVVGLSMAAVPIWTDWNSYKSSVQDYDAAIADLREAVRRATPDFIPVKAGVPIPKGAQMGEPTKDRPAKTTPKPEQQEHGPWEDYAKAKQASTRTVEIPESVDKFLKPESGAVRDDDKDLYSQYEVKAPDTLLADEPFPGDMSEEDIVKSIQTKELFPRPSFSLWASARFHRFAFFSGAALALCGLLVSAWVSLRRRSPTA